jgi:hypothetical protein
LYNTKFFIMKSIYKYLSAGAICLSLAVPASAQHDHQGGGGRPAGGGGGHVSAPAPRPQSFARPGNSNNGVHNVQQHNNNNVQRSGAFNRQPVQRTGISNTPSRPSFAGHIGTPARTGVTNQSNHNFQNGGSHHIGGTFAGHAGTFAGHGGAFAGHGGGYLPGHTAYHYNHGYYGTSYAPRLGFSLNVLPFGYYPFYFGDYQYYYSNGLFYQSDNDQYTVVEPPVGAAITTLPSDAQSIVINGQQYYEVDGVYYEPVTKDDGSLVYQVAGKDGELNTDGGSGGDTAPAAPQIGDIVSQLPPNCKKMSINGDKLYVSPDGVYYKAQGDQNNNTVYKIVGLPGDDGQEQDGQ